MHKLQIVKAKEHDLGGFTVRRILPDAYFMIGPFIFFDHMGPATFAANQGIDVRPHPHINLATITYLFDGNIQHRDNLGSNQIIAPGDINWMVAGHDIVHSERTPLELRQTGSKISGIQAWIALPDEFEEIPAHFDHYPSRSLPEFNINDVKIKLLLGCAFSHQSPAKIYSELFYLHATLPQKSKLAFPIAGQDAGAYVVDGHVRINDQAIKPGELAIASSENTLLIEALEDSQLMLFGGKPVGQRFIYWNFVSSSQEKIAKAKAQWANGPGDKSSRFPTILGDDQEFIPLPHEPKDKNPLGTIM